MKITYYGHSCFGVYLEGSNLLFDPFIKANALAGNVNISAIPADFIFLSHGHEDHVADTVEIVERTNATVVSNFEVVSWFSSKGIKNIHPMNHGGKWSFPFGTARYVYAAHSSSMPDGAYGGNPGGFVIESQAGSFYYSGDTALMMDMQLIPLATKLSAVLFPIGDNFTMGIDDAIIASDFVKCNRIIGLHYDTFGFIKINHEDAVRKFKEKGKELILLNIGNSIEI
jgi:L-ascorbate metabolism protein UlaG (beta-lactamase superfamily)